MGWFWKIMKWGMVLLLTVEIGGLIVGLSYYRKIEETTDPLDVSKLANPVSSFIYDENGTKLAEIGSEKRIETTVSAIPVEFMDALLSTEDARFYYHTGYDPIRIVKAAINTVMGGGFGSEGGSTITQQLIKLSFLDPNETSLERKIKEVILGSQLEETYTKEEILTMYVNKVYMGDGVYGLQTAAHHYYGKKLDELSVDQLAVLAGIPQAPSLYNPFDNPEGTQARRDIVLERMLTLGGITESEYKVAKELSVSNGLVSAEARQADLVQVDYKYQDYIDAVITEVEEKTGKSVYSDGLTIYTTLNDDIYNTLTSIVNTNEVINYPDDNLLVGIAVVETKTGKLVGIGSGNRVIEKAVDGFNYATDINRQPGSTIKPILAYGPAIEYLGYTADTILYDKAIYYKNGQQVWNLDYKYNGEMTLRNALVQSRNSPALQLQWQVGNEKAYTFANMLGLGLPEENWIESGAIGGVSTMNPVKMAGAYAAFGNNGLYNAPTTVMQVETANGEIIYQKAEGTQVMKVSTAKAITNILEGVVQGENAYNPDSNVEGFDIAGKTGTTNYDESEGISGVPDSWFVGYTPEYTIAVWTGYNERTSGLGDDAKKLASVIFRETLARIGTDHSQFE